MARALRPPAQGLDLLIEALSLVPSPERIPVRLHGVDWHGKRSAVSALVRDRGLDGSVAVEGPIYGDEKWGLMAGARGFLYPSRWDASPIAVVEAASIGVPTLVTSFPVGSFLASRGAAIRRSPHRMRSRAASGRCSSPDRPRSVPELSR